MNIVILGGGFRNKGNEAMLRVVQKELNQRIDAVNMFAVLGPSEHSQAYASGIVPVSIGHPKIQKYVGGSMASRASISKFLIQTGSIGELIRSIISVRSTRNRVAPRMIDDIIGGIDAVIDIHGYAFGDPWSLQGFKAAAGWGEFCQRKKMPYCFLPQTWGPFDKQGYPAETASILQNASLFYARETPSQAELARALRKPVEEIAIAPDTALLFKSGPLSLGEDVLRRIGINRHDKPLIGISPNLRVYERTSGVGSENEYVQLLSHLSEYFITHLEANVVLVPNEISQVHNIKNIESGADDRFLCNLVASLVRQPTGCFAFRNYYSAEEIHSAIGCLDLLVGSRFHSLVFALSGGVPLIALGWAHKYEGLLRLFGLGDYSCDCRQFAEKPILEMVNRAWESRESTAQGIRSALPRIQTQVDAVFDKVAETLRGTSS